MTIPASISNDTAREGEPVLKIAEVDPNVALAAVAEAHGLTATFRYAKGKSGRNIETRRCEVETIIKSKDGSLSIVGYDPDRRDVRAYRVDRILGYLTVAS